MSKPILGPEVYSVVNAALEVLSKLGHGFHKNRMKMLWWLSWVCEAWLLCNRVST
jgi:hypothetical protein